MTEHEVCSLEETALRVRQHVIRMSGGGGCFIGASLSCADILVYLYCKALRLTPESLDDPSRDYLFLSKGHDVPAMYGALAETGYIEEARLRNHLSLEDSIYWHPNVAVPGVEFHSGSLGHLLSVGLGVALDIKRCGQDNKVYVVLGDGELNEGSVWEACLVASAYRLNNLIAIVDRNRFQANMRTEDLIPLEPLCLKFAAFGWNVETVDGHSFVELETGFLKSQAAVEGPSVIIAETIRGKGVPSIESRADRWFASFSETEVESLLQELHGQGAAELVSEGLMVR
jgi:transketolase